MGNQDYGGPSNRSSHHHQEEGTRPLKKAKYVWQVKGKYHLKATCRDRNFSSNNKSEDEDEENCNRSKECAKENKNIGGCRKNCVDNFLARTEAILDSDEDDSNNSTTNIDKSISNEIPITLVSPNPKNLDYYLRKWQARQIARGYIDNTINSVLETWTSVPSSAPFDVEDFVDNCDGDGRIEDEGILMAIQSHGLQSIKTCKMEPPSPLAFVRPDELADNTLDKFATVQSGILISKDADEVQPMETDSNLDVVAYPVDILNAAILVAIERKGLSSA